MENASAATSLDGKVAVITGGAPGIGRACCAALGALGAHVVVTDINRDEGLVATESIRAEGGRASYAHLDVTDDASIDECARRLGNEIGHADILVNAAGWDVIEPFWKNAPEYWAKIVALNFMGPIKVTRAFIEPMMERGSGKIVNVSSDAGRVGSLGETVYAGAKGGIIAFTKSLARELARYRVNVNCVCPGPTDTPLFQTHSEKMKEALTRAIPLGRLGRPADVANAVAFFAGDGASFITGQVLSVSGGLTMVG